MGIFLLEGRKFLRFLKITINCKENFKEVSEINGHQYKSR